MKKIIILALAVLILPVAATLVYADTVEGTVQGYQCVTEGKTCPVGMEDPLAATESTFVILADSSTMGKAESDARSAARRGSAEGQKFYFVNNIDRNVLVRHINERVRVNGKINPKYNSIEAESFEVYKNGKWTKTWDNSMEDDLYKQFFYKFDQPGGTRDYGYQQKNIVDMLAQANKGTADQGSGMSDQKNSDQMKEQSYDKKSTDEKGATDKKKKSATGQGAVRESIVNYSLAMADQSKDSQKSGMSDQKSSGQMKEQSYDKKSTDEKDAADKKKKSGQGAARDNNSNYLLSLADQQKTGLSGKEGMDDKKSSDQIKERSTDQQMMDDQKGTSDKQKKSKGTTTGARETSVYYLLALDTERDYQSGSSPDQRGLQERGSDQQQQQMDQQRLFDQQQQGLPGQPPTNQGQSGQQGQSGMGTGAR